MDKLVNPEHKRAEPVICSCSSSKLFVLPFKQSIWWILFEQVSTRTGRYQLTILTAQMCTREDVLACISGTPSFDVMSYNSLTTYC